MAAEKNKAQDNYPPVTIYNSRWLKYPNKPVKEKRRKKRHFNDRKEYEEVISQVFNAYKDEEQHQEQEREDLKREEEKEAREAKEKEMKLLRITLNPKQVVKNRQKMQQIAFDHLAVIREEEEHRTVEREHKRHARATEKDKVVEADRKKRLEDKRASVVEMKNFNAYMEEKKRQQDLWDKHTRHDWVVEKDKPLEAKKKKREDEEGSADKKNYNPFLKEEKSPPELLRKKPECQVLKETNILYWDQWKPALKK